MKLIGQIRYCTKEINRYKVSTYAASASFFLITSLLPLLLLLLSVLSWLSLDMENELIDRLLVLLPDALQSILLFLIDSLEDIGVAEFSLSALALLWTASKSMIGLIDGLNNVAECEDNRGFIIKRLVCLIYMIVFIAGLLLTLSLRVFGKSIMGLLQKYLPYIAYLFSPILDFGGLTLYVIIVVMITMVYSFFPNKTMPLVKQIPGAIIASAAWLVFSELYSFYVEYVLATSAMYGGMGILILAMVWVYFCMYIFFLGAVINKIYPNITSKLRNAVRKKPHKVV